MYDICQKSNEIDVSQVSHNFRYLGADISTRNKLIKDIKSQINKDSAISSSLRDVIRKNKHNISIDSKVRIYKTGVRPIVS